jgi:hypothetical protein
VLADNPRAREWFHPRTRLAFAEGISDGSEQKEKAPQASGAFKAKGVGLGLGLGDVPSACQNNAPAEFFVPLKFFAPSHKIAGTSRTARHS